MASVRSPLVILRLSRVLRVLRWLVARLRLVLTRVAAFFNTCFLPQKDNWLWRTRMTSAGMSDPDLVSLLYVEHDAYRSSPNQLLLAWTGSCPSRHCEPWMAE